MMLFTEPSRPARMVTHSTRLKGGFIQHAPVVA
jgi:hypothetical protein